MIRLALALLATFITLMGAALDHQALTFLGLALLGAVIVLDQVTPAPREETP